MNYVSQQCSVNAFNQWQRVCENLPQNLFVFVRKAIILQLANNTNLLRWKKVPSNICALCNSNKQTQLHMFSNCPIALNRYTWRHDSILFTICHYLKLLENIGFSLYADLEGFQSPSEFFNGPRPDIIVQEGNELHVIELSCCYESNFVNTREYKVKRYHDLKKFRVNKNFTINTMFVEVSTLGFLPKNIREFKEFCNQFDCLNVTRLMNKMMEVAIRCSYFIYTRRNNYDWEHPEILKFY